MKIVFPHYASRPESGLTLIMPPLLSVGKLHQIRLNEHTNGRGTALLCPYKYHVQSTGFDITLSFGIASHFPTPNSCPSLILQKADKALDKAKAQGRNYYRVGESEKTAHSVDVANLYKLIHT